ncbi:hypothetical protein FRC03_001930 [Tulasnella sp. 419]|nr:hypothetical protein FRC03_001930 [Tulasnella sp. 419]
MHESEGKDDTKRLVKSKGNPAQLPLEIHVIISKSCDQPTLATLSRVSKVMKAVSQPLLYKKINLLDKKKNRIESLIRTMVTNPVLGPMVHELAVDIKPLTPSLLGFPAAVGYPPRSVLQFLSTMFRGLENLHVLVFNGPGLYDGSVLQQCSSTSISSFRSNMNIGIDTLEWFAKQVALVELDLPYTETGVDPEENVLDPRFQIISFPRLKHVGGLIYTVGSIVQGSKPPLQSVTFYSESQLDKDVIWMRIVLSTITTPLEIVKVDFPLDPWDLEELFKLLSQHHATSIKKLDLVISSIPKRDDAGKWTQLQRYLSSLISLSELHLPLSTSLYSEVECDYEEEEEEEDSDMFADMCMEACPNLLELTAPDSETRWGGGD